MNTKTTAVLLVRIWARAFSLDVSLYPQTSYITIVCCNTYSNIISCNKLHMRYYYDVQHCKTMYGKTFKGKLKLSTSALPRMNMYENTKPCRWLKNH